MKESDQSDHRHGQPIVKGRSIYEFRSNFSSSRVIDEWNKLPNNVKEAWQQLRTSSANTGGPLWALWHPPELDEVTCPLESVPELQRRHQGPMRPADYHTRTRTSDKAFKHCRVVATVVASAQP